MKKRQVLQHKRAGKVGADGPSFEDMFGPPAEFFGDMFRDTLTKHGMSQAGAEQILCEYSRNNGVEIILKTTGELTPQDRAIADGLAARLTQGNGKYKSFHAKEGERGTGVLLTLKSSNSADLSGAMYFLMREESPMDGKKGQVR